MTLLPAPYLSTALLFLWQCSMMTSYLHVATIVSSIEGHGNMAQLWRALVEAGDERIWHQTPGDGLLPKVPSGREAQLPYNSGGSAT